MKYLRKQEAQRAIAVIACVFPLGGFAPHSLCAQAQDRGVGAWAGASMVVSEVAHEGSALLGGEAGLLFGSRLRLAGAGYTLLGRAEVRRPSSTPLDLTVGYGGVVTEYLLRASRGLQLGAGVLTGAGTARIRDPVVGAALASDNFVVIEPRISVHLTLRSFLQLALSARYRVPLGVEDLTGVSPEDLRAVGIALSVSFGTFRSP